MLGFWAMSDTDKILLVLKILMVGFGWASLIIGAIGLIYIVVSWIHEVVQDWKESRRRCCKHCEGNDEHLFRNVEEILNDLR